MADSKRLAGLVGPTIVMMTASEILDLHYRREEARAEAGASVRHEVALQPRTSR